MDKHESAKETVKYVSNLFDKVGLEYWLEAGTALAAVRDGKIFDWEHDIDLGVWRKDLSKVLKLVELFKEDNCKVKIQKGLPFVDNIIQITLPNNEDGSRPFPDQVDIYLFTEKDEYAYMRWLQKPEGRFGGLKKKLFMLFRNFVSGQSKLIGPIGKLFPMKLKLKIYRSYLSFYIRTTSCIFHRFPKSFFKNLKKIDFYGVQVNIAEDTDEYLSYRYGGGWKTPDDQFNQSGKWKKSQARVLLKMSEIPSPELKPEYLNLSNV